MRICIFSGVISLDKENNDVRKEYLLQRLKFFGSKDLNMVVLSPFSPNVEYLDFGNIRYIHYRYMQKKGLKLLSSMIFSVPELINIDCDILHCLNYQSFCVAKLANFLRRSKYTILFEAMGLAHAESEIDAKNSTKVKILRTIIAFLERDAFKNSDGVIVYTEIMKQYAEKHFDLDHRKIFVVPHGVDLSDDNLPAIEPDIKVYCPEGNKIAMYVGSLSELHGTPYLMQVALELDSKKPDVCLMILGTGPLSSIFKKFVKDNQLKNVVLAGYLPSEKVSFYLSKADVLLIPHSRCLQTELDPPTKLFEYLKAGKPIVSFDFRAIAEIVGDKALLVEPDNPSKFADGIVEVLNNQEHYLELARSVHSLVESYSWEASAEKQYLVYKHIYKGKQ